MRFGSGVEAKAVAWIPTEPPFGTTLNVKVSVKPLPTLPSCQMPEVVSKLPWETLRCDASYLAPPRMTWTRGLYDGSPPLFLRVTVKVPAPPGWTLPGLAPAVRARSARRGEARVRVETSFSGFGSIGFDDATCAVLTISPPATTMAWMWMVELAPTASAPTVQRPVDGS